MRDYASACFHAMAANSAWANLRLLTVCAKLAPDDFAAKRTSFFPSIQATLNHNLTVDWFYVDALEGGTLGPAAWKHEVPCPHAGDLMREQQAVDQRLLRFCAGLTMDRLLARTRLVRTGRVQTERTDRVLLHLFQHQVHHRGQAHAMLAGTQVAPPQLDEFFMKDEAPLRAGEMAMLGLDEAMILRDPAG